MKKQIALAASVFALVACSESAPGPVAPAGPLFHASPTTDPHTSMTPTITAPIAASTHGQGTLSFAWTAPASPELSVTHYEYELICTDTTADPCTPIALTEVAAATTGFDEILAPGEYTFRVLGFHKEPSNNHKSPFAEVEFVVEAADDVWEILGFYRPVVMSEIGECNTVQRNRSVPLKFNAEKNGQSITAVADLDGVSITVQPFACAGGTAADISESVTDATGGTVLRWDELAEQFIYNWSVGSDRGGVKVTLAIGTDEIVAYFNIR